MKRLTQNAPFITISSTLNTMKRLEPGTSRARKYLVFQVWTWRKVHMTNWVLRMVSRMLSYWMGLRFGNYFNIWTMNQNTYHFVHTKFDCSSNPWNVTFGSGANMQGLGYIESVATLLDCATICADVKNCAHVSFNKKKNRCYLKTSDAPKVIIYMILYTWNCT